MSQCWWVMAISRRHCGRWFDHYVQKVSYCNIIAILHVYCKTHTCSYRPEIFHTAPQQGTLCGGHLDLV
jgi:hypothetical protein